MPPVIEVKHLTKEYNLGTLTSAKDTLRHTLARLSGKKTWSRKNFKALDDVNFTIEQGEVVGIIGHNGAGKSTLLKHLANITRPTSGEVIVRGSIAPLIEVGAGVNPELTGRENIFLNGAILGIPKKVIQSKLDEIIDFSELEEFIDTPVKRYSSGMTVKLGFSIATSMDADILIIDEVLAVGDLAFQRKCFDRMENLIKNEGKTVLLVSHNIRQVERLCDRVILLNKGRLIDNDQAQKVCSKFYQLNDKKISTSSSNSIGIANQNEWATGEIQLRNIKILNKDKNPIETILHKQAISISLEFEVISEITDPVFGIGVHTTDFIYLATQHSINQLNLKKLKPGIHTLTLDIPSFPFMPGVYSIRSGVAIGASSQTIFYSENLLHFEVITENLEDLTWNEGIVSLPGTWSHG